MKKNTIVALLAVTLTLLIVQSGAINSFFVFLLIGAVPGTTYVIPPSTMLVVISLIAWLILLRFTAVEAFFTYTSKRTTKHHQARKKRLPMRRFSEI